MQRGAKAARTNFMKWARKKPTNAQKWRTAAIAGGVALIAATAGNHIADNMRTPRVQNVIRESLQGRASHIGEEVQKRGEYLTAMETQKRLNRQLHTRKYLDRFWKYMHDEKKGSNWNLTEKEKKAVEGFCKKYPAIPLTHLVVTLESNPPERNQSDESHINEHLYGESPRKGVVLAAAYEHAATDDRFRAAIEKLQYRGREYPGYSMHSVEFMDRALNDGIKGLPAESPGLLSKVHEHWTGQYRNAEGLGNMLPRIHTFRPEYTPFLTPGSLRFESGRWIYSNEIRSDALKEPGAIRFTSTSSVKKSGPESLVKPSARNLLIAQAKKSFRGKPPAQAKPKRAPETRRQV